MQEEDDKDELTRAIEAAEATLAEDAAQHPKKYEDDPFEGLPDDADVEGDDVQAAEPEPEPEPVVGADEEEDGGLDPAIAEPVETDAPDVPVAREIPVLRDRVSDAVTQLELPTVLPPDQMVELQTELAARVYRLSDDLLRVAVRDLEATLFEDISEQLRERLPDLIDEVLVEVLGPPSED